MAWEARLGLKLKTGIKPAITMIGGLNGLGSPSGIETLLAANVNRKTFLAKWPGKPVWD